MYADGEEKRREREEEAEERHGAALGVSGGSSSRSTG